MLPVSLIYWEGRKCFVSKMTEEVSKRLHEQLKNWLIALGSSIKDKRGADYYSKVWTGDSEALIIPLGGNYSYSYSPDVIWKRRDQKCIFETAFTEDWRAVAGEICLASMVDDCVRVFIIDSFSEKERSSYENIWKNYVSMVGKKTGLKYGAELISFPSELYENGKIVEIKKLIQERLKDRSWVF